jgi:hypothetical protein
MWEGVNLCVEVGVRNTKKSARGSCRTGDGRVKVSGYNFTAIFTASMSQNSITKLKPLSG